MTESLFIFFAAFGAGFVCLGAFGLLRLPDLFCRAHALTKAMTIGLMSLLVAFLLKIELADTGVKMLLIMFFQFSTIPLSGHLLGKLAFKKNVKRWKSVPVDDHRK